MKYKLHLFQIFFFLFLAGCGSSGSNNSTDKQTISIEDMTFIPSTIEAAPGETIIVINNDDVDHTLTSESDLNMFDDSGEFDTGTMSTGEIMTIEIPSDAEEGDTLFFYCKAHEDGMTTPNGRMTII